MTPQAARAVIVSLVAHGFDHVELIAMGHAELQWWADGVRQYNRAKNEAERKAAAEAQQKRKR